MKGAKSESPAAALYGDGREPRSTGEFAERRYTVLRQVASRELLDFTYRYIRMKRDNGLLIRGDHQTADSWWMYADAATETLLEYLRPAVEAATRLSLIPTYSYLRVYLPGATLKPHVDRPSCEISASLTIGRETNHPWPLYVRLKTEAESDASNLAAVSGTPVNLDPGDMLIYRGMEVVHWREAFDGSEQVQAFLHYVDREGGFADQAFDRRPRLGFIPGQLGQANIGP